MTTSLSRRNGRKKRSGQLLVGNQIVLCEFGCGVTCKRRRYARHTRAMHGLTEEEAQERARKAPQLRKRPLLV